MRRDAGGEIGHLRVQIRKALGMQVAAAHEQHERLIWFCRVDSLRPAIHT